jgi:hypothetical protein
MVEGPRKRLKEDPPKDDTKPPDNGILFRSAPADVGMADGGTGMATYRVKVFMAATLSCIAYTLALHNWVAIRELFTRPW